MPVRKNTFNRKNACLLVLLTLTVIVGLSSDLGREAVQPLQYSHLIHVADLSIECVDCHLNALTGERATIPNIEICGACHFDIESENPEEKKVAIYVENGEPIPWIQVHEVPDHAFFSHRRHSGLAGIQCEICHGDVAQMSEPYSQPFLALDMEWCIDCHRVRGASNDCYACHR